MAAFKSILKLQFSNYNKHSYAYRKLKVIQKTINKHIDTEYKKQKQAMDKAENVIDSGLDSGNLDLVKMGLDSMTGFANHNPLADLKNHLDNQIEKDFDDDDFIIEI